MHPLEQSLILTVKWLLPALAASPMLLAVPQPDRPLGLFTAQLTLLVVFGVALAVNLARFVLSENWFGSRRWPASRRRLAAACTLVALDAGAVALLTLASSAALRLEPSLQFLQLLSALDISWAGTAIALGAFLRWRTRLAAALGGAVLGAVCILAAWRYLDIVGFTATGGWKVSASDLMRYVIPVDMVAAIAAVAMLWVGAHTGLRTEHERLQS